MVEHGLKKMWFRGNKADSLPDIYEIHIFYIDKEEKLEWKNILFSKDKNIYFISDILYIFVLHHKRINIYSLVIKSVVF